MMIIILNICCLFLYDITTMNMMIVSCPPRWNHNPDIKEILHSNVLWRSTTLKRGVFLCLIFFWHHNHDHREDDDHFEARCLFLMFINIWLKKHGDGEDDRHFEASCLFFMFILLARHVTGLASAWVVVVCPKCSWTLSPSWSSSSLSLLSLLSSQSSPSFLSSSLLSLSSTY